MVGLVSHEYLPGALRRNAMKFVRHRCPGARSIPPRQQLGPRRAKVTMLADYGNRYQSKLFNPEFLRSEGLPIPAWLERKGTVEAEFA